MPVVALATLVILLLVPCAFAGPADLDATFGNDGIVTVAFPAGQSSARAVVLQADGMIVGAGAAGTDVGLVRVDADGIIDASFGGVGLVTTNFGDTERANAIVQQSDGKLVIAGEMSSSSVILARYQTTGFRDGSFGAGGLVFTPGQIARALVLQPDGMLVAGGPGASSGFMLIRYDDGGAVDPAFGTGGVAGAFYGSPDLELYALALQPDGKIIAAGGGGDTIALARFNDDGTPDGTFGTGGEATTTVSAGPAALVTNDSQARAIAVQPDGKVVVAAVAKGFTSTPGQMLVNLSVAMVLRYDDQGVLDPTFGFGGIAALNNWATSTATANAVVLEADGRVLAAGWQDSASNAQSHLLARLTSTGQPDPSFLSEDNSSVEGGTYALALQPDRKVVAAGFGGPDWAPTFQLLRYQGGECGDGVLDGAEECDDGNLTSGDGCDANCTTTGCGNGIITAGEQCETESGDCCSATCQFESAGTPCAGDGDACSNHSCDGAGACESTVAPAASCATTTARMSLVKISRVLDADKRAVQWRWKGTGVTVADFDDPRTTPYALCIYERTAGTPALKMRVRVPTSECPTCWRTTVKGFDYKDRTSSNFGVGRVILQVSGSGIAKLKLKAKGPALVPETPLPMSVDPSATVQLRNTAGDCWGADFSAPTQNTAEGFKAKSD